MSGKLAQAFEEYYQSATAVSLSMIRDEASGGVNSSVSRMHGLRDELEKQLERNQQFRARMLTKAFGQLEQRLADVTRLSALLALLGGVVLFAMGRALNRNINRGINALRGGFARFGGGDYSAPIEIQSQDELGALCADANAMADKMAAVAATAADVSAGCYDVRLALRSPSDRLAISVNAMIERLQAKAAQVEADDWLKTGLNELSVLLSGVVDPHDFAVTCVRRVVAYLGADSGVFYGRLDDRSPFDLLATAGLAEGQDVQKEVGRGEGRVGRCARLNQVAAALMPPSAEWPGQNTVATAGPGVQILTVPLPCESVVVAVVELSFANGCAPRSLDLVKQLRTGLGLGYNAAVNHAHNLELLRVQRRQQVQLQRQKEVLLGSNALLEDQQVDAMVQSQALERRNRDLVLAQRALQEQAVELARANQHKSQFLTTISHELRTPLNSMLMLAQILSENGTGNLTDAEVKYAQTIAGSGKKLLDIINDILDMATIEAGHSDLRLGSVNTGLLCSDIEEAFAAKAQERGLLFFTELSGDSPEAFVSDGNQVLRVLSCLVDNAIKFTKNGKVVVSVKSTSSGGVAFAICDTGIGLKAEDQEVIFERFKQLDGSIAREYGGTGLGLSIAHKIVGLLGGSMGLESELGVGSKFKVELPLYHPQIADQHMPEAVPALFD